MTIKLSGLRTVALAAALLVSMPQVAKADAKTFTELKCNKCHSIKAAGVEVVKADPGDEEDASGPKPPDLSTTGKYHDAAFLESYLKRDVGHVAHEGDTSDKKHKMKFKGTDDQLKQMATWLASLK